MRCMSFPTAMSWDPARSQPLIKQGGLNVKTWKQWCIWCTKNVWSNLHAIAIFWGSPFAEGSLQTLQACPLLANVNTFSGLASVLHHCTCAARRYARSKQMEPPDAPWWMKQIRSYGLKHRTPKKGNLHAAVSFLKAPCRFHMAWSLFFEQDACVTVLHHVALNVQLALHCFSFWGQVVCGRSQTRRPKPGPICWKGTPAATSELPAFERLFWPRHVLEWNVASQPKANRTDAE